jgi:hypothetical protein
VGTKNGPGRPSVGLRNCGNAQRLRRALAIDERARKVGTNAEFRGPAITRKCNNMARVA